MSPTTPAEVTNNSDNMSRGYTAQYAFGAPPKFSGKPKEFKVWLEIYMNFLCCAQPAMGAWVAQGAGREADEGKDKTLFSLLHGVLDHTSIKLISTKSGRRGTKALEILTNEYLGSDAMRETTCIMSLLTIKKFEEETLTEYVARTEELLDGIGEENIISDKTKTLVNMQGLPEKYGLFKQVLLRSTPFPTFSAYKDLLKREENSMFNNGDSQDAVMKARVSESAGVDRWKLTKCFNCQKLGHRAVDCTEKKKSLKRWCNKCESSTHNTNKCWRKSKNDSAKVAKVRSECSDTQRVPEK
ncbi:unnamed protein product, partial [Meganyctiphanes norvegica]